MLKSSLKFGRARLFPAASRSIRTVGLSTLASAHPAERRPKAKLSLRTLCASAVLLLATAAHAATVNVTDLSDNISSPPTGSLRAALSSAGPGDIINFAVTGTISLTGPLPAIAEDLTIIGPGASSLAISGNHLYGVFAVSSGIVSIAGLTIANANNQSGQGGAISNGGTLTVSNVIFNQDVAISAGGAIYNTGTLIVSGSSFSNNQTIGASSGGAIWNSGILTVYNSVFSDNSSGQAGSIANTGTLTVSDSVFSGNYGAVNGGAILNSSGSNTATVTDSFFLNNSVSTAPQGEAASFTGGAIQNDGGTLTVGNSTFVGNSAPAGEGGAIANGATLTLSNNTFVGNTSTGGAGGAIVNSGGTLTLSNSILSGNGSGSGAGVERTGGTVNASYNVFYQNLDSGGAESDCVSCSSNLGAIDANPQLAPLGNYGGTTETMLPLPGSPAICAGSFAQFPSGVTTDQRGFPLNSACVDAGAVQTNYLMVNTTADRSDASCGSTCSLRDAIQQAESAGTGDIAFASSATGTITLGSALPALTGQLNIAGPGAANLTVSGGGSATVGSVLTVSSGAQIFLSGLTIANGNANSGGGILNLGTLTITNSAFAGNSAPGNLGGAIENSGTLTVANSTFSANSCGTTGGAGGAIDNSGTLAVANSTFSGNSSGTDGGVGGALYDTGSLTVSNSTFVGNSSANGGGVAVFGGTATITNSIFAHNTSPSNGAAVFTPSFVVDASNNLFFANIDSGTGSESDCFGCTTNTQPIATDPMLAALSNYGGPTQTMLPLPGSAAICAGSISLLPAGTTTDQRGFARLNTSYSSSSCLDVGAVQTNYQSMQFAAPPYSGTLGTAISPAPVVSVTENGLNQGGVPVTLVFSGTGTATGLGPIATVSGLGASFSNLVANSAGNDTLLATLQITPNYPLTATTGLDVTTDPQTITFPSPATPLTYGAAPITLTATASSTLPVTFALVSGPATLSGSTLRVTGAGTIVVEASQGGNATYAAATPVQRNMQVNPAPLAIVVNSATRSYGTANPTFTGTPGTFVNGDTAASTGLSYTTTATSNSPAGTYPITAVLSNAPAAQNYSMNMTEGTLTVLPAAPVLLLAPVAAQIYGTAPFPVTATSTSNAAITYSVLSGPATIAGNLVTLTGAGTVVLQAAQAVSGNYVAATAQTSFTVTQPAFTLAPVPSGTSTTTGSNPVVPGGTATFALMLAPMGTVYPDAISLSATGLPPGATAVFSPASIPAGSPATAIALTIQTSNIQSARTEPPFVGGASLPIVLSFLLLPLAGWKRARQRLQRVARPFLMLGIIALSLGVILGLSGCGTSDGFFNQRPQTYTVKVTATDIKTNAVASTNVTLTVQ
jgi:CSLREA domain-containing protein